MVATFTKRPTMRTTPITSRRLRVVPAAVYCGSSVSTLNKRRCRGEPPPFIKIGKIVLYDVVDLDEWLASCRRRSTSDPVQALDTTAERLHHRHSRPPK